MSKIRIIFSIITALIFGIAGLIALCNGELIAGLISLSIAGIYSCLTELIEINDVLVGLDASVSHPALEETKNIISIEKEVKKK